MLLIQSFSKGWHFFQPMVKACLCIIQHMVKRCHFFQPMVKFLFTLNYLLLFLCLMLIMFLFYIYLGYNYYEIFLIFHWHNVFLISPTSITVQCQMKTMTYLGMDFFNKLLTVEDRMVINFNLAIVFLFFKDLIFFIIEVYVIRLVVEWF